MNTTMIASGIEWIGDIPEGTPICRLKFLSYMKGRIGWQGLKSEDFIDEGPYCVTGTDFDNGKINWNTCYHVSEERYAMDENIQLRVGDLLVTKDGTIGKLAKVTELPDKACLNSHLLIIRPTDGRFTNEYLYYVMSSPIFTGYYKYTSTGSIMESLSQKNMGEFAFPLYDIPTQNAIVAYLDQKCAAIDEAIKRHKMIIEKLDEYWKSVVWAEINSHVDTTGKLKILFELHRGYDLTANSFVSGSVPVYGSGGFVGYHNEAKCNGPNVVIGRSGSTGKLTYVPDKVFWAHNTGIYVSDFRGNIPKYIYYLLLTIDIDSLANKTAVPTLDRKNVQNHVASFTTNTEQQQSVVDRLDVLNESIQKSMTTLGRGITKLEEYRKSIIYNAVTGIDCRTEASL